MNDGPGTPGSPVLVLNSGSSSVKFALIRPGTGERLMAGMGERLGTPEAVLRLQTFPAPAVSERLPDGSHRAAVARVLEHMTAALDGGVRVARGGSPGGARRRAVQLLDPGGRRGYRRAAHVQSPGAAAQPGESRRHRGRTAPYCPTCRKSPCSIRRFIRPCRRTLSAMRCPRSGTRGTACGVTGFMASAIISSASRPPYCSAGRPRAAAGHRPPRQRVQRGRRARRRVGGHHDGADPAGGAGHGDPLRRRGSRPARLPGRPDRHEPGHAHHHAQYRQRASGPVGRGQRHAHGRSRGRGGERAGPARRRGFRVPARQGDSRARGRLAAARRADFHRRHRREQRCRPQHGAPATGLPRPD